MSGEYFSLWNRRSLIFKKCIEREREFKGENLFGFKHLLSIFTLSSIVQQLQTTCLLGDTSRLRQTARHARITHALVHTWAHTHIWLDSVTVIDRGKRRPIPALPPRQHRKFCSLNSNLASDVDLPANALLLRRSGSPDFLKKIPLNIIRNVFFFLFYLKSFICSCPFTACARSQIFSSRLACIKISFLFFIYLFFSTDVIRTWIQRMPNSKIAKSYHSHAHAWCVHHWHGMKTDLYTKHNKAGGFGSFVKYVWLQRIPGLHYLVKQLAWRMTRITD